MGSISWRQGAALLATAAGLWIAAPAQAQTLVTQDLGQVAGFRAGATVLTFDDHASTSDVPGSEVDPDALVLDDYAGQGVFITSAIGPAAVVYDSSGTDAKSGRHMLAGTARDGSFYVRYDAPISFHFLQPSTGDPATTNRFGFWNDPTGARVLLSVYGADDQLLESVEADQGYFAGITRAGIARAEISYVSPGAYPGFSVDDVTFGPVGADSASAVPEPGAMLLFLPALGVVAALRKRTSRSEVQAV